MSDLVKQIERALVTKYGKAWRRMLSPEVQKALVTHEAMLIVFGWLGADKTPAEDVKALVRAAWTTLCPEE